MDGQYENNGIDNHFGNFDTQEVEVEVETIPRSERSPKMVDG